MYRLTGSSQVYVVQLNQCDVNDTLNIIYLLEMSRHTCTDQFQFAFATAFVSGRLRGETKSRKLRGS